MLSDWQVRDRPPTGRPDAATKRRGVVGEHRMADPATRGPDPAGQTPASDPRLRARDTINRRHDAISQRKGGGA
jgi:hypothetical protein